MRRIFTAAALFATLAATPTLAHHPFAAEYDWKKPVTLSGTVTRFDWKNPHSVLEVKGKDDKGKDAEWTIELGSPGQLSRAGWSRAQLKSGDQVTVDGWMSKTADNKISAKSVTTAGGRELFAASSFYEASRQTASTEAGATRHTAGTAGRTSTKPKD